jgi:methylated-DNA-protein-cysteine methyltransferase-like protein
MPKKAFTEEVIEVLRDIPCGKVATYGGIAALAGNPRAARQVVRVLHSYGEKEKLPWWRVINKQGTLSLERGNGYEVQRDLLEAEGIVFDGNDRVDLGQFLWKPDWL